MKQDKEEMRVVHFLLRGSGKLERNAGRMPLIDCGERGTIAVSTQVLQRLVRTQRVVVRNGTITAVGATPGSRVTVTETMATPTGPEVVTLNVAESPLGALWRHKDRAGARFLSADEFSAGERLRSDYTRAQIMPRLGVNWDAAGGAGNTVRDVNGMAGLTDTALAARLRVEKAIEAVGPELAGVLVDICCFLKGLETVETERLWPARSAKIMLKSALGALSRHYQPKRHGSGGGKILRWGSDDYRPRVGQGDATGHGV